MNNLDSKEVYEKPPYLKAFSIIREYVNDLLRGINAGKKVDLSIDSIGSVALIRVGGSGIICDVAAELFSRAGINVRTVRSYEVNFRDCDLAIAVSHSGNTAEAIKPVLSLMEHRVKCVFITSGGILGEVARKFRIPTVFTRRDVPSRYDFPSMLGAMLGIMEKLGMKQVSVDLKEIREFQSKICEDKAVEKNPAKNLAIRIVKAKPPIIYVYERVRNAGYRLKCQLNENSKIYCGFAEIPEALHNDIEGLPPESLIILPRSFRESSEMTETIEAFIRFMGEGRCVSIMVDSKNELNELLQLFLFMDYTSLYAAVLKKVDPLTVPRVSKLRNVNKLYSEILGKKAGIFRKLSQVMPSPTL